MATLASLVVNLRANTAQYQKNMNRSVGLTNTMRGSVLRLGAALGAGFGLVRAAKFIVNTNREFEKLNAQLITVTGSQAAATAEFRNLERLAVSTPFQIEELTQAFIQLRVFGVEPTNESFNALGDFASAFGTTINEMSIVIRSATAGQTESIRRFVENFEVMGEQVAITFNGVRTVIDRNAQSISDALVEISKNNFAGAMAREMETLNGVLSNLEDSMGILARTSGEVLLPVLTDIVAKTIEFTESINSNRDAVIFFTRASLGMARVLGSAVGNAVQLIAAQFVNLGKIIVGVMTFDLPLIQQALSDVFAVMVRDVDDFRQEWERFWREDIMAPIPPAMEGVAAALNQEARALSAEFEKAGETIAQSLTRGLFDGLSGVVNVIRRLAEDIVVAELGGRIGSAIPVLGTKTSTLGETKSVASAAKGNTVNVFANDALSFRQQMMRNPEFVVEALREGSVLG